MGSADEGKSSCDSEWRERVQSHCLEWFGIPLEAFGSHRQLRILEKAREGILDGQEALFEALRQELCVGETFFLRHPEHFEVLRNRGSEFLRAQKAGRKIKVWSAGCATGEEPHSIAWTLYRTGLRDFEVLGTDLREDFLAIARKGEYRLWSLRGVDLKSAKSWLLIEDGVARVRPTLLERTQFRRLNLNLDPFPQDLDGVFCRNVLLYFSEETAAKVLERMAQATRPGGFLFLGLQDPRPTPELGWEAIREGDTLCYRRIPDSQAPPASPRAPRVVAPSRPSIPLDLLSLPPRSSKPPAPRPVLLGPTLAEAKALADQRHFEDALKKCRKLFSAFPLEAEPYVLAAMLMMEAESFSQALEFARKASFLAPENPFLHYLMASLFEATDHPDRSEHHFQRAVEGLGAIPDLSLEVPLSQGLTGHDLDRLLYERTLR